MVAPAERQVYRLNPDEIPPGSYESFSRAKFYRQIDQELLRRAPVSSIITDAACGTGVAIEHLIELGKTESPFTVTGIDIDPKSLDTARQKFREFAPSAGNGAQEEDTVTFIQSPVESTPQIPDDSQQLVTFLNSIHLTDVPSALKEMHRILKPNGVLLVNSAYEASSVPKEAFRFLGLLVINARRNAQAMGFSGEFEKPLGLQNHSMDDYRAMATAAGFEEVKVEMHDVNMGPDDWKAICDYDDFAQGTLPGVPVEMARQALVDAVDPTFTRMKIDSVPRRWMFLEARKGKAITVFEPRSNNPRPIAA